jgi:hypothetical protein
MFSLNAAPLSGEPSRIRSGHRHGFVVVEPERLPVHAIDLDAGAASATAAPTPRVAFDNAGPHRKLGHGP